MPDYALIWWFIDHAAGVSSAAFGLGLVLAWWWHWRRPREPKAGEIPPMSARWLTAKDRFKTPHRE